MSTPWLSAPASSPWQVRRVQVPGTCCSLGLPDGWDADDPPAAPDGESAFAYRGESPVEWLTVRHRTDSTGGELASWVEFTLRAIGFPVLPPSRLLVDLPKLAEWGTGQADDPGDLGVDELRTYRGSAAWTGEGDARRLRLYVVLARRGREAWNIALSMDTAALPGMPAEFVAHDDDVRAAAVLGALCFVGSAA